MTAPASLHNNLGSFAPALCGSPRLGTTLFDSWLHCCPGGRIAVLTERRLRGIPRDVPKGQKKSRRPNCKVLGLFC